jgi:hypothetical protein
VKLFVQKALNFVWFALNVASHHGVNQLVAMGHEKPCFTGFQMAFVLKPIGPGVLQRLFLQAAADFMVDGGLVVMTKRCRAVITASCRAMIAKDHCDDQKAQTGFHCLSPFR